MAEFNPIFIEGPTEKPPVIGGSVVGSIAGAALTPFLGPFAPIVGGFLGGLFDKPKSGGSKGLTGALGTGLSSLFGSSSSSITQVDQTQAVNQATRVDVQNILGDRPFGNANIETGDFDTFQALSDVFAIKMAQDRAAAAQATKGASAQPPARAKINFLPLFGVLGLVIALRVFKIK